jgi:hypothetical protein
MAPGIAVHETDAAALEHELIEVQTGSYLGEDDILRIEDDFNRTSSDTKPSR